MEEETQILEIPPLPRDLLNQESPTKSSPVTRLPTPQRSCPTRDPLGLLAGSLSLEDTPRNRMPQDLPTAGSLTSWFSLNSDKGVFRHGTPQTHALGPQLRDSRRMVPEPGEELAGTRDPSGGDPSNRQRIHPRAGFPQRGVHPMPALQVRVPHRAPRRRKA